MQLIHTLYLKIILLTSITLTGLFENYATLMLQLLKNPFTCFKPRIERWLWLIKPWKRYISKCKQFFVKKIVHIHLDHGHWSLWINDLNHYNAYSRASLSLQFPIPFLTIHFLPKSTASRRSDSKSAKPEKKT